MRHQFKATHTGHRTSSWKLRAAQAACGLSLVSALVVLPMPVFADNEASEASTQATSTTVQDSTTETAEVTPAPTNDAPLNAPQPTTATPEDSGTTVAPASESGAVEASEQTSQSGATIDNKVTVKSTATSGDATVTDNRTAGDASTGDADNEATIVNVSNANGLSAGNFQTFNCDIREDVQENIVIDPATLLPYCSNTPALAVNQGGSQQLQSGMSMVDILNTIVLSAASGNATVSGNTEAGNAATGDAAASLTVMNLTGQEVVAKNSLLVFVNVLGKWMGMIVPAPGSKTAMLGSGIQSSSGSAMSNNQTSGQSGVSITNNVDVSAMSGDAAVTGNRTAGGATTGSAKAGVNLLNISNSSFRLDDWFGALFINVLGSWLGNFDIQKLATAGPEGQPPVQAVQVYQLAEATKLAPASVPAPTPAAARQSSPVAAGDTIAAEEPITASTPAVLGASTISPSAVAPSSTEGGFKLNLVTLSAVVAGLTGMTALATAGVRRYFAN